MNQLRFLFILSVFCIAPLAVFADNTVSSTTPPTDPKLYGAYLAKRLKKHWFPVLNAGNLTTVIKFIIQPDGTLKDLSIARSSGNQAVNAAARRAVESSAPFGPLPAGLDNKPLHVTKVFNLTQVNDVQLGD
ncbi:MAG: TonB family protein [Candidatus Melainabacteria bacterium]|nr:TonB family protein [Candidatus Melainabacteria bacterium]